MANKLLKEFISNLDESKSGEIVNVLHPYIQEVTPMSDEIASFELAKQMQGNEPLTKHEDINWN